MWMGSKWVGALMVGGFVLTATAAQAKPTVRVAERLSATAAAPAAKGRARLVLKTDQDGRLGIGVRGLAARTAYDVVIGGVRVAALSTNGGGGGRVRFSTKPKGGDELLGVDPRGQTVVIRDAAGNDVLAGTIEDGTDDPTQVACCLPNQDDDDDDDDQAIAAEHDGEDENGEHDDACADLTPEQCGAEGGTVMTADSCIPNPCDEDEEIVCCLPGDSAAGAFIDGDHGADDGDGEHECHVGCEDTTPAACAEAGGTVVAAESCEPNPCAPLPPTDVVACCLTEDGDDDVECEAVSVAVCEALGGQVTDAPSCHADPCE